VSRRWAESGAAGCSTAFVQSPILVLGVGEPVRLALSAGATGELYVFSWPCSVNPATGLWRRHYWDWRLVCAPLL
jgi:hypothetical protein